jgi:hypothetical protein
MPIEVQALDEVKEVDLIQTIKGFAQDGANIVTAINGGKGTFSVEAIFIDPGPQGSITRSGKISTFGGPNDLGVSASEPLALYDDASSIATAPPGIFLATQPPGTTGTARRLNPDAMYIACRWVYAETPRDFLRRTTVKVSAGSKPPVEAHPVDWGPNIRTNRIADLSPGLARALGVKTDEECTVEIPLPATVSIPAAAPAPGVDLTAVTAMSFPSDLTRTLVVATTSGNTTHWVLNLIGHEGGGQTLMRKVGNGPAESLRSDAVILPIKADAQISDSVAAELNKAIQKEPEASVGPAGPAPGPGDDINAKVLASAIRFVGHDTSHVPLTHNGHLACAWAVNEVVRLALSKPVSTEDGGGNGLSTVGLFAALKAHHTRVNSAGDVKPGMIIIAPTEGENHGHVGIVGALQSPADNTPIVFSNSSNEGKFAQNFTIKRFTSLYTGHGLDVLFFALKGDQFHS